MHWINEYLIGFLIVALPVVSDKICMPGIPVLAKLAYSHDNQVQFMLGWSKYFYVIQFNLGMRWACIRLNVKERSHTWNR
jgi:hypothetical protein